MEGTCVESSGGGGGREEEEGKLTDKRLGRGLDGLEEDAAKVFLWSPLRLIFIYLPFDFSFVLPEDLRDPLRRREPVW